MWAMKAAMPPILISSVRAVEYIMQGIKRAGYKPGEQVALGMDAGVLQLLFKHSAHV